MFNRLQSKTFLSTSEVNELVNRGAAHLSVLNASLSLPGQEERVMQHAKQGRIPGAIFFDLDRTCLDAQKFKYTMESMGVHQNDFIVLYDNQNLLAASRAFWLLTLMGCPNVHIMNGTFGKWKNEERETNFYESEDLWHKLATEKQRRRF